MDHTGAINIPAVARTVNTVTPHGTLRTLHQRANCPDNLLSHHRDTNHGPPQATMSIVSTTGITNPPLRTVGLQGLHPHPPTAELILLVDSAQSGEEGVGVEDMITSIANTPQAAHGIVLCQILLIETIANVVAVAACFRLLVAQHFMKMVSSLCSIYVCQTCDRSNIK